MQRHGPRLDGVFVISRQPCKQLVTLHTWMSWISVEAWVPQIAVLEAAEARLHAAAAATSDCEQAAQQQQQRQLSAAAARGEAALQEAQQAIARLQRWGPDVAVSE